MIPNSPGFVIISLLYKLLCDIEGSDSILIIAIEIVNRAVAVILCMIHKCGIINIFRFFSSFCPILLDLTRAEITMDTVKHIPHTIPTATYKILSNPCLILPFLNVFYSAIASESVNIYSRSVKLVDRTPETHQTIYNSGHIHGKYHKSST